MSQITKALKITQELRDNRVKPNMENVIFLSEAPRTWPKTALMAIVCTGYVVALLFSTAAISITIRNSESRQIEILNLERTIKAQEKRINTLVIALNKSQKSPDGQNHNLSARLKKDRKDIQTQINNLASTENAHYDNIKEAILDDKEQIDFLNKELRKLQKQ
ncbi:MAG: hypothetical protein HQL14_02100 [Candidatus Omnitrophica bacterium]|nr:hypothetical protein [Candidatus Omnitrophota bacterium]